MIKVFSKQWFKKYSKWITRVARLPILGELIFSFKKFGHYIDRNKIVEVTPNSVIEFVSWKKGYKEVELRQHFFVRNEYALRLQSVFYPIWITFHIWDIITRPIPQLNLGFDTLTVYPAEGANSPVDGVTARVSVNETLANIIAGAGAYSDATITGSRASNLTASTTSNQFSAMYRCLFLFDTSSITSTPTISSAVFSLWGYLGDNGLGNDTLNVVASTPASDSNLANGDYSNLGSTSFGSVAYASFDFTDSVYTNITLNASGLSAISKTGITKLGTRGEWDRSGTFSGTWASGATTRFNTYHSDNGSNKPKLVVTYTVAIPSDFFNFF